MKLLIKNLFKKILSFLGLKIARTDSGIFASKIQVTPYKLSPSEEDKFKWLQNMNINTIIDVGAHKGEFAAQLHKILPNANIYCFEPLPDIFLELNANLKKLPNFKLFNLAIGAEQGELEMYRSEFSPSSSLVKMAKLHKENYPFSSGESLEKVKVKTLDEIAKELKIEDNLLLKIDVQGYEDKVINGAKDVLNSTKVLIIETSFRELYEGQVLFSDIYKLLSEQGFVYSGNWEESKSPIDGIPLQQDSIFIKK